jgi:hypothetical protein
MKAWVGLCLVTASSWVSAGTWSEVWGPDAGRPPARYPIRAYSEFLPAPKGGARPYEFRLDSRSTVEKSVERRRHYRRDRPSEFQVPLFDEIRVLRPGLTHLTRDWLKSLKTTGPVAALFSVSLTETQDWKGMTPWTVLGGAEGNPEEEFWRGMLNRQAFPQWLCGFLSKSFLTPGPCLGVEDLQRLGLRVLSRSPLMPAKVRRLAPKPGETFSILFTFQPEAQWPASWRTAFNDGKLTVIPHPSTLAPGRATLARQLAATHSDGAQIPLAEIFARSTSVAGLMVPKAGELKLLDSGPPRQLAGLGLPPFSVLGVYESEPLNLFRLIFDSSPESTALYGKPTARNTQIWGTQGPLAGRWLLDGPKAGKAAIDRARETFLRSPDSRFAYREAFAPLDINGHEAHWHRPVAAWYFPAEDSVKMDLEEPGRFLLSKPGRTVELRAAIDDRWGVDREMAEALVDEAPAKVTDGTAQDVRRLLEHAELSNGRIPLETASVLVTPAGKPSRGQARSLFVCGVEGCPGPSRTEDGARHRSAPGPDGLRRPARGADSGCHAGRCLRSVLLEQIGRAHRRDLPRQE